MNTLRETPQFVATSAKRGVRVACKLPRHHPKSRVIGQRDWRYLKGLDDGEFRDACVLDFGIGVFQRRGD